ncbi:hypothetical protein B0T22DRAFT_62880 [Podospora appendiculata]|uniref:Zn(2)-C6 fungal-type domain-containing protein n=1 Tax=Podospora appendiculata TaxID=314037 RepID=A0AAE0XJ05_9PEZI|nr:hypothetical protein B0T22DRAFT_62880 [Podospora appendiculata]
MDGADESGRRHAKVGHRKSRNGCKKCKTRRVKCDESRPVCRSCARLGLECEWPVNVRHPKPTPHSAPGGARDLDILAPSPGTSHSPASSSQGYTSTPGQPSSDASGPPAALNTLRPRANEPLFASFDTDSSPEVILPESRERRMLEHRLMQHYIRHMVRPSPLSPGKAWSDLFTLKVPELALENDNLLYCILANASSNLLRREPGNQQLFAARQSYLIAAIREQRKMVNNLNIDNADAVCLASLLLLVNSWAALQDRPLEPYSAPLEWLMMGRGAGALIWMSIEAVEKCGSEERKAASNLSVIRNSYPRFGDDESYFDASMRANFTGVLTQKLPSGDTWDDETRDAYEKALSYVGSIQRAIDHGEPVYAVIRRVQVFALLVPRRFVDFLEEKRPRSLVILAHFFTTVAQLPNVWWIGADDGDREPTPTREIRAISEVLPAEWQGQLVWPLDIVGLR